MKWSKIFVRFNEIKFVHNFSNIKLYAHVTCVIYITLLYITFCFIYSLRFIFFKFFRLMWREKQNLCMKVITYGGRGFPSLSDHMKTENHVRNVVIKVENYRLPGIQFMSMVVCMVPHQCIWISVFWFPIPTNLFHFFLTLLISLSYALLCWL